MRQTHRLLSYAPSECDAYLHRISGIIAELRYDFEMNNCNKFRIFWQHLYICMSHTDVKRKHDAQAERIYVYNRQQRELRLLA